MESNAYERIFNNLCSFISCNKALARTQNLCTIYTFRSPNSFKEILAIVNLSTIKEGNINITNSTWQAPSTLCCLSLT